MYEMKDEYLTGIEEIDNEHRQLFEIAQEAYQLMKNEFIIDKYDDIKAILRRLKEYTIMHFEHEEEYMESINYKRLFSQKIQHNAFKEKLEEWNLEDIDENSEEMITKILEFLADWLVNHILYTDKQISES